MRKKSPRSIDRGLACFCVRLSCSLFLRDWLQFAFGLRSDQSHLDDARVGLDLNAVYYRTDDPDTDSAEQLDCVVDLWHLAVVAKIGLIAAQFGCRPTAQFPQIEEYSLAENARVTDVALMCTDGPLIADSALFEKPNTGHRSSPWARCPLKLHTIESARERYAGFAAEEHDRVHSGPQDGWIDPTTGETHWIPKPENPYRRAS